jgi:hypothetical protein
MASLTVFCCLASAILKDKPVGGWVSLIKAGYSLCHILSGQEITDGYCINLSGRSPQSNSGAYSMDV